ncbi:MAG: trimethylamine methyltransferase, partial [Actinobacteria bacterium]|nr:trimethylamine methyltransferase [Actinomycetota bacterium]
HTMERFRDCFYRPFLTNSDNYERWMRLGAKDTRMRAEEIWKKKLEDYEKPEMDAQVLAELTEFVAKRKSELDA